MTQSSLNRSVEEEILAEMEKDDNRNVYDICKALGGDGILVLFADSGAGKTRFSTQAALDARRKGISVTYWDTEGGPCDKAERAMIDAGVKLVKELNPDVYCAKVGTNEPPGLVIVDSATLFISGLWFKRDAHGKGALLQRLQSMYFQARSWAQKNKSLVVMVAQPKSNFGKSKDERELTPMGDKADFMAKTSIYMRVWKSSEGEIRKRVLRVHKSREIPDGTILSQFETTDIGVNIIDWQNMWRVLNP